MFQGHAETFDEVIHQNNVIAVIGEVKLCEKEAEVMMERKGWKLAKDRDESKVIEKKKDPLTWMTGKGNQKCPKSHAVIFVGHVKQFLSFRDIFYDPS